jgi:hypothetical protein
VPVVQALCASAGEAMLANAIAAMKASFDLLIIVLLLGDEVLRPCPQSIRYCATHKEVSVHKNMSEYSALMEFLFRENAATQQQNEPCQRSRPTPNADPVTAA